VSSPDSKKVFFFLLFLFSFSFFLPRIRMNKEMSERRRNFIIRRGDAGRFKSHLETAYDRIHASCSIISRAARRAMAAYA